MPKRWLLIFLFVGAAAVLGKVAPAASAAYDGPICLEYADGASRSCFYSNYEGCRYDAASIFAAVCIRNPFYRHIATRNRHADLPSHHRRRS
jgi:hypothetical protein